MVLFRPTRCSRFVSAHIAGVIVCTLALLASCQCYAQLKSSSSGPEACTVSSPGATGSVSGVVLDPAGAGIGSALVRFSCGSKTYERKAENDGHYAIDLPFGSYQVTVSAASFATVEQTAFRLDQRQQTLNFNLSLQQSSSIVNVTAQPGYVATSSTAATKTGTPLLETPQTVSVITLDQMEQRGVQTLSQALDYTAGVGVNTYGTETRFDWFNIRGFDESTYGLFRDNSRWQTGPGGRPDRSL